MTDNTSDEEVTREMLAQQNTFDPPQDALADPTDTADDGKDGE